MFSTRNLNFLSFFTRPASSNVFLSRRQHRCLSLQLSCYRIENYSRFYTVETKHSKVHSDTLATKHSNDLPKKAVEDAADSNSESPRVEAVGLRQRLGQRSEEARERIAEGRDQMKEKAGALARLTRQYGMFGLITYLTVNNTGILLLYIYFELGVGFSGQTVLNWIVNSHIQDYLPLSLDVTTINPKASNFTLAWALNHFLTPIQLPIALWLTPKVSKLLMRYEFVRRWQEKFEKKFNFTKAQK